MKPMNPQIPFGCINEFRQGSEVFSSAAIGFLCALCICFTSAVGAENSFVDPAEPKVNKVSDTKPLPAARGGRVKVYAKPKPLAKDAMTHDWTQFLGPTLNGISTETKLLKTWPKAGAKAGAKDGPTLIWQMEKGTGYSSPAIAGQRLVFLHRMGDEEIVECLHPETGRRYWTFKYPTEYEDRYGYNNGPRASPLIDGDYVYIFGAEGKLHCLYLPTGQLIWKRDPVSEFKSGTTFFGMGSTPLLLGDLLIINVGAPDYKIGAAVVAFNKKTGKVVWYCGDQWGPSYASPIVGTVQGKQRVFVLTGGESRPAHGGLLMIDPKAGRIDMRFPWRSRSFESVNASSPVIVGNQVFVSASYRAGAALLNIKPDMKHEVAWEAKGFDLHWNTAIHKDGYLYGFAGRNEPDAALVCYELKTGKEMWREVPVWDETTSTGQALGQASTFRGSLLWADGHFLCLGELGHLLWLDLTPKGYKQMTRSWLFASRQTWALPVLSHGLLYVTQNQPDRTAGTPPRLLCYDLRGK
jgi:outer membrane protein assembly factor BamB